MLSKLSKFGEYEKGETDKIPVGNIKAIQFGLLSPDAIQRQSVVEITNSEKPDGSDTKPGSLFDPHMGCNEKNHICKTCGHDLKDCQGHFAHINLAAEIYHLEFIEHVANVHRCVCFHCSKLLIDKKDPGFRKILKVVNPAQRRKQLVARCRPKNDCSFPQAEGENTGCMGLQPKIRVVENIKLQCEFVKPPEGRKAKFNLKAKESLTILKRIGLDDEDRQEDVYPTHLLGATNKTVWRNDDVLDYKEGGLYSKLTGKRVTIATTLDKNDKIVDIKTGGWYTQQGRRLTSGELDLYALGFDMENTRPSWMIIKHLPVPPMTIRPSNTCNGATRGEDDLTTIYTNIININNNLKEAIARQARGETPDPKGPTIDGLLEVLQSHVVSLFDYGKTVNPNQAVGKPLEGYKQRLTGKKGRIRETIMGKRVDHAARTPITPDANISVDQVGVPYVICRALTYTEYVSYLNIDELRIYVERGTDGFGNVTLQTSPPTGEVVISEEARRQVKRPSLEQLEAQYGYCPGANFVVNLVGQEINLKCLHATTLAKIAKELKVGMYVRRHLKLDDYGILNRQPSLHRNSFMGHRILPMPYSTFRLNLSVTTPYNADFDGDEMNLHIPQTHETRAEVSELMAVPNVMLTPQSNKNVMGLVQDGLLAPHILSKKRCFIEKDDFWQLISFVSTFEGAESIPLPAIQHPRQLWTGKQAIGFVFPKINAVKYSTLHPDAEDPTPHASSRYEHVCKLLHLVIPSAIPLKEHIRTLFKFTAEIAPILDLDPVFLLIHLFFQILHQVNIVQVLDPTSFIQKFHSTGLHDLNTIFSTFQGYLKTDCQANPATQFENVLAQQKLVNPVRLLRYLIYQLNDHQSKPLLCKLADSNKASLEDLVFTSLCRTSDNQLQNIVSHLEQIRSIMSISDTRVVISDGELLSGKVCKRLLGTTQGSLVQAIVIDYGPKRVVDFINDVQYVANTWVQMYCCSVGTKDIKIPKGNDENVANILRMAELELEKIIKDNLPKHEQESKINKVLNDARKKAHEDSLSSMAEDNIHKNAIECNSKGSVANPAQTFKTIGQNNVMGQRMPNHFEGRTLPCFERDNIGPREKGFIVSCYVKGLTPSECYMHGMSGREGLIDTAVKTSEVGYIQRRLQKAGEDGKIAYDMSVRNSNGRILQFVFGDDGLDPSFLQSENIEYVGLTDTEFFNRYILTGDRSFYVVREYNRLVRDWVLLKALKVDKNLPLPTNPRRFLDNLPKTKEEAYLDLTKNRHVKHDILKKYREGLVSTSAAELDPNIVARELFFLQQRLAGLITTVTNFWDGPFAMLLRSTLSSKRVIQEYKMKPFQWAWILQLVEDGYTKARANPGDNPGTISAQAVSEPPTQMTFNSTHSTGQSEKQISLSGIPRVKEICNTAKKIKTPSMTVYLKKQVSSKRSVVEEVMRRIEYLNLKAVTSLSDVVHEPGSDSADPSLVRAFSMAPDNYLCPDNLKWSEYIVRLELGSHILKQHRVRCEDVVKKIKHLYGESIKVEWSDEWKTPIIRIRPTVDKAASIEDEKNFADRILQLLLDDVCVSGVFGVLKCYLEEGASEYYIKTQGVNLYGVMAFPEVDAKRIFANDLHQVYSVFGVTATYLAIVKELKEVLSFNDNYINIRHTCCIASIITHRGGLTPITRHGLNRNEESGPLAKAAFEETTSMLCDAAQYATKDWLKGATESVFVGTVPPIGTNSFGVYLDHRLDVYTKKPEERDLMLDTFSPHCIEQESIYQQKRALREAEQIREACLRDLQKHMLTSIEVV